MENLAASTRRELFFLTFEACFTCLLVFRRETLVPETSAIYGYRVGASLVCRAWLRAEADNPVQHTHLSLDIKHQTPAEEQVKMIVHPKDTSRMRWEFRRTSCLLSLDLHGHYVAIFLAIKPELTRLESLTLARFACSEEHIRQLLYLTSLKTLQVRYFLTCPARFPAISCESLMISLMEDILPYNGLDRADFL